MIFSVSKNTESSFFGKKIVTQICKGAKIVWESVRSCFGAGYWKNEAPWSNIEGWKN